MIVTQFCDLLWLCLAGAKNNVTTAQATAQDERTVKIIEFCKTERTASEMMDFLELAHREYFRSKIVNPLLEQGLLHPTIPDKLTSPKQKYFSSLQ